MHAMHIITLFRWYLKETRICTNTASSTENCLPFHSPSQSYFCLARSESTLFSIDDQNHALGVCFRNNSAALECVLID